MKAWRNIFPFNIYFKFQLELFATVTLILAHFYSIQKLFKNLQPTTQNEDFFSKESQLRKNSQSELSDTL